MVNQQELGYQRVLKPPALVKVAEVHASLHL